MQRPARAVHHAVGHYRCRAVRATISGVGWCLRPAVSQTSPLTPRRRQYPMQRRRRHGERPVQVTGWPYDTRRRHATISDAVCALLCVRNGALLSDIQQAKTASSAAEAVGSTRSTPLRLHANTRCTGDSKDSGRARIHCCNRAGNGTRIPCCRLTPNNNIQQRSCCVICYCIIVCCVKARPPYRAQAAEASQQHPQT